MLASLCNLKGTISSSILKGELNDLCHCRHETGF
jgi:hypothetical protein